MLKGYFHRKSRSKAFNTTLARTSTLPIDFVAAHIERRAPPPPREAMASTRQRALSLMRSMLRCSMGWQGDGGRREAEYIVLETSKAFRARRDATDPALVERYLREGEERLYMANNYKIAYARLPHVALGGGGDVKNVLPPAQMPGDDDAGGSGGGGWTGGGDGGSRGGHVGGSLRLASASTPVNPRLNAARAAARAKRAAMSKATATDEADD